MVRACGIEPTDPYLEWCWLPVVEPSTVALVRHVAELTSSSGEARIPLSDLGRLLGLGAVDEPSRNNKLVRTVGRSFARSPSVRAVAHTVALSLAPDVGGYRIPPAPLERMFDHVLH